MRRVLLSLLLLLLAACSSPQLPPLAAEAVVLAFGDSLTYGSGVQPDQSYPAVLAQLIGREVVNGGVPGEISSEGLARLPALLDEVQPQLLILCHGGNDMIRKHDLAAAAENLRRMVRMAQERRIAVVLLAVPRPGIFMNPAEFYEEVAGEKEVPIEMEALPRILADRSLKSDPIHPNGEGYRQLAEAIANLLRERGAIPAAPGV